MNKIVGIVVSSNTSFALLDFIKTFFDLYGEKGGITLITLDSIDCSGHKKMFKNHLESLVFCENKKTLQKLIKEYKFDVLCDFMCKYDYKSIYWGYLSGVKNRILYIDDASILKHSYFKYATSLITDAPEPTSKDSLLKYYDGRYKFINITTAKINDLKDKKFKVSNEIKSFHSLVTLPTPSIKINLENPFFRFAWSWVKNYNHKKYWKRRFKLVHGNVFPLLKIYYLYYIKRKDAFLGCSFGTEINKGALFLTPPHLPHGPGGIIVGHDAQIGRNVIIYQQVTIMHGGVKVGNNVVIGAGAKILPNVKIGHNAKVGANCVVVDNIPAGATVVLPKPRIIINQNE